MPECGGVDGGGGWTVLKTNTAVQRGAEELGLLNEKEEEKY